MKLETERLIICDFTMDMAGDVHMQSLDEADTYSSKQAHHA